MATINLSSTYSFSNLRLFSSFPQNTPSLSLFSQAKPKPSLTLPSISLKPYNTNSDKLRLPSVVALAVKNLGKTDPIVVLPENDAAAAAELPSGSGVYAIYDKNDELQFIGLSRNIAASVSAHRKSVPELVGSVKVRLISSTVFAMKEWISYKQHWLKIFILFAIKYLTIKCLELKFSFSGVDWALSLWE